MKLFLISALALCLMISGCGKSDSSDSGSSDSFNGVYEVTKHTKNSSGCDSVGEAVEGGDIHFKLSAENLFGTGTALYNYECSSATKCSDSDINANWYFPKKIDGIWQGDAMMSGSGSSSTCNLFVTEVKATLEGSTLTMEAKTKSGQATAKNDCAEEYQQLIEDNRSELTCSSYEVITSTKL